MSNNLHFGESIISKGNQHSKNMYAPVLMLTLLSSIFNDGNNLNVQHQMHGYLNDGYLLQEAICRPTSPVSIQDSYSLDSEDLSQTQSKGPQHRYEKGPADPPELGCPVGSSPTHAGHRWNCDGEPRENLA